MLVIKIFHPSKIFKAHCLKKAFTLTNKPLYLGGYLLTKESMRLAKSHGIRILK